MKQFYFLILIFFTGTAIFGATIFNMGLNHAGVCAASAVGGTACPTDLPNFAAHHISALQVFIAASPALNWIFLAALALLALIFGNQFFRGSKFPFQFLRILELYFYCGRKKFISWLSLREFSPVFANWRG